MFPSRLSPLRPSLLATVVCAAALAGGCAHSEYDLVQPTDLSRHIGTKTVNVPWAPLEYRFTSVEDHLVARVYNGTDEPVRVLGEQSVVVDPKGQSHPLASRTIAPQSFIKLVLPPLRPVVGPVGPTIGIGFGFGGGFYRRGYPYRVGYFYDEPGWYGPPYYAVYDDGQGSYWRWPDEGSVRLVLAYERGGRPTPAPPNPPPPAARLPGRPSPPPPHRRPGRPGRSRRKPSPTSSSSGSASPDRSATRPQPQGGPVIRQPCLAG